MGVEAAGAAAVAGFRMATAAAVVGTQGRREMPDWDSRCHAALTVAYHWRTRRRHPRGLAGPCIDYDHRDSRHRVAYKAVVPQKAWRCPEVETVGMRWGGTSFAGEGRLSAGETRRPKIMVIIAKAN